MKDWQILIGRAELAITRRSNGPSDTEEESGGLLFLGNAHETVPQALLLDPHLGHIEIVGWQMIRLLAGSDRVTSFPTYEQLRRLLRPGPGKTASKATVARMLFVLRLTRWLSLCSKKRDKHNGRIIGNVYALHDEPLSPEDAAMLDPDYRQFVHHCLKHENPVVRKVAQSIHQAFDESDSPDCLFDRRARRFEEMNAEFSMRTQSENSAKNPGSHREPSRKRLETAPSSHREPSLESTTYEKKHWVLTENPDSTVLVHIHKSTSTSTGETLYWDDALRLSNQEREDLMSTVARLDTETAQYVLDETAGRVRDGKARHPKALLLSLINSASKGDFKITQYAYQVRKSREASESGISDRRSFPGHDSKKPESAVSHEEAQRYRKRLLESLGLHR